MPMTAPVRTSLSGWGRANPSIADVLDVPVGTVKSRLHAALGKLAALLRTPDRVTPTVARPAVSPACS